MEVGFGPPLKIELGQDHAPFTQNLVDIPPTKPLTELEGSEFSSNQSFEFPPTMVEGDNDQGSQQGTP